jgi:GT2 family glycosyltransferase
MTSLSERLSVVLLTYNRAQEVLRSLRKLLALPEPPQVIVVDNASEDGTADLIHAHFPQVQLIVTQHNIGAAARNIGVQQAQTKYVAFCDDDSWWAEGALEQAVQLLDAHPGVAALSARILLGPDEMEDPICKEMAESPLPSEHLPGRALLGFIACAAVFRRDAYLEVGGYQQRFFVGGEEELVAMDLWSKGWSIVYAPQLIVHHWPSPVRDNPARQKTVIRNALWVAWLRLPAPEALRRSWEICSAAGNRKVFPSALAAALRELSWVAGQRKVVPDHVLSLYRRLHG